MAFPTIEATNTSVESSIVTSHDVSLPASISAGDLLLALLGGSGSFGGITPGSWTEVFDTSSFAVEKLIAAGSEGASVAFSSGSSVGSVHNAYRISGASGDVEIATTASNNNPPSLSPSWGAEDTLWIAGILVTSLGANDVTAAPTNYGGLIKSAQIEISGTGVRIATASRQLNTASEDPGAFTVSGILSGGTAFTIAVRPSAGSIEDAVGSAAGTSTATGVGVAVVDAVGSAVGTSAATGALQVVRDGTGTAAGTSVASAVSLGTKWTFRVRGAPAGGRTVRVSEGPSGVSAMSGVHIDSVDIRIDDQSIRIDDQDNSWTPRVPTRPVGGRTSRVSGIPANGRTRRVAGSPAGGITHRLT